MKKYIDLHMHSKFSDDGDFTPTSLVKQAHEAGLTIMAIADHNSVRANQEARIAAKQYGIRYIPAIEIDCVFQGVNLHVLGYGIDFTHQAFFDLEKRIMDQEYAASAQKIELTNALGFSLTKEDMKEVAPDGIYTGEMFCEVLLAKPVYQDHELLKPYRKSGARDDNPFVNFYWDYYSQGKACYTEIEFPSLEETIYLIHSLGGVSVLAHPGNNLKGQFELVDKMLPFGLAGIEVFSNYHDPETIAYFYENAKTNNLLITCGSDYHGKTKPAIKLGECRCTIDEEVIEAQLKTYQLI